MKMYLISFYEAYMADEEKIVAVRNLPNETSYYKYEVLEETEIELPKGYEICQTKDHGEEIFIGNEVAEMVTEKRGASYVTSLVSSEGAKKLHRWSY